MCPLQSRLSAEPKRNAGDIERPRMKRVFITGSSGYFGSVLVAYLASMPEIEQIVGTDLRPPAVRGSKFVFYQRDVRSPSDDLMTRHAVDAAIHAAWVLPPIHDKAKMEEININGTRAVQDSVIKAGVRQFLYTSSTTAYGFHSDNEIPLTESSPLRGNEDFTYCKCKRIVDKLVQDFAEEHPELVVTVVRPCFVVGPGFDNPLANYLRKRLVLLPSQRHPLQFVHETDLVEAMCQLLFRRCSGVYNIAGDGLITFEEMVRMLGGTPLSIPFKAIWLLNSAAWFLRLSFLTEFPSSALNIFRHPWLASSDKLKKELGYEFQYTTRSAFEDFVRYVRDRRNRTR